MYEELAGQLDERGMTGDYVVFASGSSGTHAGMMLGEALFGRRFATVAINVDEPTNDELEERTRSVYAEGAALLGLPADRPMPPLDLRVGYVGAAYGILWERGAEAIRLLARSEGILLDPVYTSKAMVGLIDLIRSGEIGADKTVVFVHTGGAPALFTQAEELLARGEIGGVEGARWWDG